MMDLDSAARAVGGRADGGNPTFLGVSTDSRSLAPGSLFVALAGDRFDGHQYLAQARERGALAAMVDAARVGELAAAGMPLLAVDDTRRGLGRLAAAWRRRFALPLIAVTGSNGKTTVKEMIGSILREQARLEAGDAEAAVLATRGNLNNDIGLPLTLLTLSDAHRWAVVEMGMNHPGEIAALADIAAPTVAVVNNAQRAHVEGMGSLDAIVREKGSIIAHAAGNAVAVINADDAGAPVWREMAGARRVVDFSLGGDAAVRGAAVADGSGSLLRIETDGQAIELHLAIPGGHNARNALAAAAATLAAGVGAAAVRAGLQSFHGVKGRLQWRVTAGGARLLDDTYNANPDSVRAGLDVLASLPGRRVFVFGDMGEVGGESTRYHEEIGVRARELGIEAVLTLGVASVATARSFGRGGAHFDDVDALVAALAPTLAADTTVLVKGSRFMKMERVADALCPESPDGGKH